MIGHISIDVMDAKQCAVSKEKFRINKYNFGQPFEDLVHSSSPYVHFQVLRPKNEEQHDKAIAYFNEQGKLYAASTIALDILLYIGCTNDIYIKSGVAEVDPEEFKSLMMQACHWFRFYGKEEMQTENEDSSL